jgi:hypothetical protein
MRFATLFAAAALAGAAAPAAADAGLGAAFNSTSGSNFATNGTTVMVPIRTGEWLIEPQLAYQDSKVGNAKTKVTSPAVGLYMRKEVGSLFEAYYGGILGYNKGEAGGVKTTSFSIIPTVGVAHYFSKQFSLAVDAGLEYTDGTAKGGGGPDQDIRNLQTVARIVLRGYFF